MSDVTVHFNSVEEHKIKEFLTRYKESVEDTVKRIILNEIKNQELQVALKH